MAALIGGTAREDASEVEIVLAAKAENGSNFGIGVSEGQRHAINGTELETGLPLCIFAQKATVRLKRAQLEEIPYFASKLRGEAAEAGDGKQDIQCRISTNHPASDDTKIEMTMPTARVMNAFLCILVGSVKENLAPTSMFPLYVATSTLRASRPLELVEQFIWDRISSDTVLTAARLAIKYGRKETVKRCYYWFRAHGALSMKQFKKMANSDATDKAVNVAVSGEAQLEEESRIVFDTSSGELCRGSSRVPASIFDEVIHEAHVTKTRFFVPPSDAELADGTPPTDGEKKGDDNETKEKEKEEKASGSETDGKGVDAKTEEKSGSASPPSKGTIPPPPSSLPLKLRQARKGKGFAGLKRCYLVRNRNWGPNGDQTRFLLREEGVGDVAQSVGAGKLLLAACTTSGKTFSLSSDPDDFSPTSPHFLGNIDCSFTGTTFTLSDYGIPEGKLPKGAFENAVALEHCAVVYDTNVLGRVPNSMTIVVPRWPSDFDPNGPAPRAHAEVKCKRNLASKYSGRKYRDVVNRLRTRKPIWSEDLEAWTMDFHGRVKVASKKNFLLVSEDDDEKVILLFGKVTKSFFSLDFGPPMTATQAITVALSSFADKLMVT
eukprot:g4064.t1